MKKFFTKALSGLLCAVVLAFSASGCGVFLEILSEEIDKEASKLDSIINEEQPEQEPVECDNISAEIIYESNFEVVDRDNYCQYSQLSNKEKKVYRAIDKAVKKCEISVDVRDYEIDYERALDIVELYMADNPQNFYLARTINALHYDDSDDAVELRLSYTDGTVTDEVDENNQLTAQADRGVIEEQIAEFNTAILKALDAIPENTSEKQRVRLIHNYIIRNTEYDSAAAEDEKFTVIPRAYDSYGAAVKGMAVCEGYSKFFQYLCYLTGIECGVVVGTGDGEPHMWNVAKVDGRWLHTDVTWDDPVGGKGKLFDDYLNLSWYYMSVDHVVDSDILYLPD